MSSEAGQLFPNKGQGHIFYMEMALKQAASAFKKDEVPIGAVVIQGNAVVGRGYNQRETLKDPTAHAEMSAITAAANTKEDWRLDDCVLYVTKEPCSMCAGAVINSRISELIFGAYDDKKGCCGSLYQLCGDKRLDSRTAVKGGVEEQKCTAILQEFFQSQRS